MLQIDIFYFIDTFMCEKVIKMILKYFKYSSEIYEIFIVLSNSNYLQCIFLGIQPVHRYKNKMNSLQHFCMCQHLPFRYIVAHFHMVQTIVSQLQLHRKVKQSIIHIQLTEWMLIVLEKISVGKLIFDENIFYIIVNIFDHLI